MNEKPDKLNHLASDDEVKNHISQTVLYFYPYINPHYQFKIERNGDKLMVALVVHTENGYDMWNYYNGKSGLTKTYTLEKCCIEERLDDTIRALNRLN